LVQPALSYGLAAPPAAAPAISLPEQLEQLEQLEQQEQEQEQQWQQWAPASRELEAVGTLDALLYAKYHQQQPPLALFRPDGAWHTQMVPLQEPAAGLIEHGAGHASQPRFAPAALPLPSAIGFLNEVCQREYCCNLAQLSSALRPKLMAHAMQSLYTIIWGGKDSQGNG
jgi:hypothetical protein